MEWFHMRSNILECVASTCLCAGICLSSTIRVMSLKWVLLYSSMTLFSIWTLPVGCCCCGGGFHQRISTDLLIWSHVTGIGSSPGMLTRPPTTTMQSCAGQSIQGLAMCAWGLAPFMCSLAQQKKLQSFLALLCWQSKQKALQL
jgi:hypothetical protein